MRFGLTKLTVLFTLLIISLESCASQDVAQLAGARIKHVVIIVQENRSFDNLFHGFQGADTTSFGYAHNGKKVALRPSSLKAPFDLSNGVRDFRAAYENGKLDGFDLRPVISTAPSKDREGFSAYSYVPSSEIQPYLLMARQYVLADHAFQSNIDQSFVAHLYLIAGQAARSANVPTGRPWGCDAGPASRVQTLKDDREFDRAVFPCFDIPTLGDELDRLGLTWRYYAPQVNSSEAWGRFARLNAQHRWPHNKKPPDFGQLWSSYDAIAHARYGPAWTGNVESPPQKILTDVRHGHLANVTWVIPDFRNSDHPGSRSDTGPAWVASVVNAIGESRFWPTTAIFVIWDDSGGWYDHVVPPQLDFDGLGFRVPLIAISPYAKSGFVSHSRYETTSILRFTETVFNLAPLAQSDRRANPMLDCFAFNQAPRRFELIAQNYNSKFFISQRPSLQPPDTH
jgi:phospholipase C